MAVRRKALEAYSTNVDDAFRRATQQMQSDRPLRQIACEKFGFE
jgi:hypothetical protein